MIWHYDLICDLPITVSYLLFHSLLQYYSFSALTLLVGRQEEHPACRNRLIRCDVVICLQRGADCFAYGTAYDTASQDFTISCLL